jgi:hypothetical protein
MTASPVIQAGSERPDRKKSRSDLISRRASSPTPRTVARLSRLEPHFRSIRLDLIDLAQVDRRLAYKNLRTALIAGAISLIVFALAWVVGLVY